MFYLDMPDTGEIAELEQVRADACVSIYLPTTPISREIGPARIQLGNMARTAITQLEESGLDKRRIWPLEERFEALRDDIEFWNHQARSLAILATPDSLRTYRLANRLGEIVEVSDRFHLKPLLRAITFSHSAFVLALSENATRLIELSASAPAVEVDLFNLPSDAASLGGPEAKKGHSGIGHRQGDQAGYAPLARYIRRIDAALRPVLRGANVPVVLAAAEPLAAMFRAITSLPLAPEVIEGNPDRLSAAQLADAARPILDAQYDRKIEAFRNRFEQRAGENRTTTDLSDAARLATFGGIDSLLIDMDSVVDGFIDEETGEVSFDSQGDAANYGIVDEIAGRALRTGASVLAVRRADIPDGAELAAILRYPI